MFEKLVAIEPVSLIPSAEEELHRYAKEVVLYRDCPAVTPKWCAASETPMPCC